MNPFIVAIVCVELCNIILIFEYARILMCVNDIVFFVAVLKEYVCIYVYMYECRSYTNMRGYMNFYSNLFG